MNARRVLTHAIYIPDLVILNCQRLHYALDLPQSFQSCMLRDNRLWFSRLSPNVLPMVSVLFWINRPFPYALWFEAYSEIEWHSTPWVLFNGMHLQCNRFIGNINRVCEIWIDLIFTPYGNYPFASSWFAEFHRNTNSLWLLNELQIHVLLQLKFLSMQLPSFHIQDLERNKQFHIN